MASRIQVGQKATVEHTFTPEDVATFARLSGDSNPVHLEARAGRAAGFDREVVHGVLVPSLISRLLGTQLPGPGTILLGQELRYRRPVYPGDRLSCDGRGDERPKGQPVFGLRTWVETHEVVLEGEATVIVRELDRAAPDDSSV